MRPSYQMLIQNLHNGMTDGQVQAREVELAVLAEQLGFSEVWCVEHHFDNEYSMCPDNMQMLSYIAGRTTRVNLVPAAVILPWWTQPLRVAEKLAMLDHLSGGRVRLGLGRGLSRGEYARMGIDMNESRGRFDEAAGLILDALDTGVANGTGTYFDQPAATLAPAPDRGFRDRLIVIAMSPDSLEVAARLGAAMATFVQFPIEQHAPLIAEYQDAFREFNGEEPPPPTLTEFLYCHEDPEEAERVAREFISRYFTHVMRHYEFAGQHFDETTGYKHYGEVAALIREAGQDAASEMYVTSQTFGTPEQIIEKVHARRDVIGEYHLNCAFSYAGMPYDRVEASMRLFSEKVMPQLP